MKACPENRKCLSWVDYWSQDDFWKDSPLWEVNARLFNKSLSRIIGLKKDDCVLNIGCGSGYTEAFLAPLVKSVHAVDVAKQFLEKCSERCKEYKNVSVGCLSADDYTNLEGCKGSFSLILCVSVVQCYRNIGEIEGLVSSAKKIASPGARMLIADLPLERTIVGFIWDALCSYSLSIREGYSWILLRTAFARWCGGSRYKAFSDKIGQLHFTADAVKSLAGRLGLNARVIKGDFSVCANRLNLLIQF